MDVKALAENVGKFIGHYSGELRTVAATIETVLGSIPMDAQDKERISGVLDNLQNAASAAADGAAALQNATVEVVVSAQDVKAAVAAYFAANPPHAPASETASEPALGNS